MLHRSYWQAEWSASD